MEPPRIRDYYADLCIQQSATAQDIRRAHRVLAIRLHPDKQPPGAKVDTEKFRIIQEAYEYLRDASRRNRYDMYYEDVKEKWRAYREFKNEECERERQQQAEKEERQRQADEAQRARRKEEARKAAEEMAERLGRDAKKEEMEQRAREYWTKLREREDAQRRVREENEWRRKLKEEFAELRSKEAARKAREQQQQQDAKDRLRRQEEQARELKHQQERAAQEQLHRKREAEAERKSMDAAERAQKQMEETAQERLKMLNIEEKLRFAGGHWAELREAADKREAMANSERFNPFKQEKKCDHTRYGWPRKKGQAICTFCGEKRAKFSFRCPDCDAAACPGCKAKYCYF